MRSAPSAAFRRFCFALALLATTWSLPGALHADAYPLAVEKIVADTLKPNVLIVLETAESMQNLPGENPARYNEVGADCEEGNRQCRLVGQDGRWNFSGMGQNGMYFGVAPSSCTSTATYTAVGTTNTTTSGTTSTMTNTTVTTTMSGSGTQSGTGSGTASSVVTGTGTATATGTVNATSTATGNWTVTASTTETVAATLAAASSTATANSQGIAGTATAAVSTTTTSTGTVTLTGTVTVTNSAILTGTVTGTATVTASLTRTLTGTTTQSSTVTVTGAVATNSGTVTASGVATATGSVTGTMTMTLSGGGTGSASATGTGSATVTRSQTSVATVSGTAGRTMVGTAIVTQTVNATGTNTVQATGTVTRTVTANGTQTVTATKTAAISGGGTAAGTSTATYTGTATGTSPGGTVYFWNWSLGQTSTATGTVTMTYTDCKNATGTLTSGGLSGPVTVTLYNTTSTATVTRSYTPIGNNFTWTMTSGSATTHTNVFTCPTGAGTKTCTGLASTVPSPNSKNGTFTGTYSETATSGTTSTGTGTACATVTGTATVTLTGTVGGTATASGTATVTATGCAVGTGSVTASAVLTGTATATGSMTAASGTASTTITGTISSTGTGTQPTTTSTTTTTTITTSGTATATYSQTLTHTISSCGFTGSTDPNRCDATPSTPTTAGYCGNDNSLTCNRVSQCTSVKGDYCQAISSNDGAGRPESAETCCDAGSPCNTFFASQWGSCKHGVVTANTTCASRADPSCNTALPGDFCAEGQPAHMCSDSGLWCKNNSDCPGTETCVAATSRMMTVKRALRRAITDYSGKVNFGFMNTYQGKGVSPTDTDASTAIFPYVRLQSSASTTVTETKLLTRGELEKAGCFTLTSGPSASCMIDSGGNGAINNGNAGLNQVTYSLVGTANSRWVIPRGDGTAKSNTFDTSWSSCSTSPILPACEISGQGTGLYEGSYYSFSYPQGTPVAAGPGSLLQPKYYTSYKGKYYRDPGDGYYYNAIDAQRTDIVNDGVYGRPPYTLVSPAISPYTVTGTGTATGTAVDTSKEASVPVPWGGSTDPSACGATTGATWNSGIVPFLNATSTVTSTATSTASFTFNGAAITPAQKTLMTTARLDKASFGGVYAGGFDDGTVDTGRLSPLGCALGDAGSYMSTVKSNDLTNNNANSPCWSNNIVLVVDGQSNGPGDTTGADCASTACAYSATNTSLAGCNCSAITRAKALSDSGVQTYVVVNAPATWSVGFQYTYAFLWNLGLAGSHGLTTTSFGTTESEVYKAVSDKIAAAAYHFPYTTTSPASGATTQDPTTHIVALSNFLYDTSTSYPSWKGTLRAFDTTSSVALKWDAATVAANGHPADWTNRRIFFSDKSGNVVKVAFSGSGATGAVSTASASALFAAGLGATSTEADLIMQWLLGKPGPGNTAPLNPAPLMGAITSSTPIVVGQGAPNGLNGSIEYSASTWKRPQLVYVGADDGMLHAFFAQAGDVTLGVQTYAGGEEAFAFIPNDMLPVITQLYAQGGQKLAVDKSEHIFGLAGSPKIKDMCFGTGCDASTGTDWHTVLVMPEGPGGNKPFALDITNAVDQTSGLQGLGSSSLLWSIAPSAPPSNNAVKFISPAVASDGDTWRKNLGQTTSMPAFYFAAQAGRSDNNRAIFASGYAINDRATSGYANQGLAILNVDVTTGQLMDSTPRPVTNMGTTDCSAQTPTTNRALMADVVVARDYSSLSTSQNLMAAYVVDTYGNTFQYVPSLSSSSKLTNLYTVQPPCKHPLYFAPALVQLDRAPNANTADTSSKHFIYLVQVTNSNLDASTIPVSASYPPSQMVVTKVDGNVSPPAIVTSYNPLNAQGQIVLTTDPNATDTTTQICLQTTNVSTASLNSFTNNIKTKAQTCAAAGGTLLPSTARPVATPTAVLRSDGLGFQIITGWFDPTATANNCSGGSQFNYGTSYVTVHEFGADGTYFQIAGVTLSNTVLTGVAFIGTGLFVDGLNTSSTPQGINIGETFSTLQQLRNNSAPERYLRTSWTERLDL